MKQTMVLPVVALLVGVAGGFLVGRSPTVDEPSSHGGGDASARIQARSHERAASEQSLSTSLGRKGIRGYEDLARVPGLIDRAQAMIHFYQGLAPDQFESELEKLQSLPLNDQMLAGLLLFSRWGEVDAMEAIKHTHTMGNAQMMVRSTILQAWASTDPVNAASYFQRNPKEFEVLGMFTEHGGGSMLSGALAPTVIAGEWAKQDPDAALKWASSMEMGRAEAYRAIATEVAKSDPAKAAMLLAEMDPSDATSSYRSVAEAYGRNHFSEAKAWIRSLPADQQSQVLASAISGLAKSDAQAAAREASSMVDGRDKDRAVAGVVEVMSLSEPQKAADFLASNGSTDAHIQSMRRLMLSWAVKDPTAALNYVENLPQGRVRDLGVSSYVFHDRTSKLSDLVMVAESITNKYERARAVDSLVGRWMKEDRAAAKAYVQQSPHLSRSDRDHYLKQE